MLSQKEQKGIEKVGVGLSGPFSKVKTLKLGNYSLVLFSTHRKTVRVIDQRDTLCCLDFLLSSLERSLC